MEKNTCTVYKVKLVTVNRNKHMVFMYGLVYSFIAREGIQKCANKDLETKYCCIECGWRQWQKLAAC